MALTFIPSEPELHHPPHPVPEPTRPAPSPDPWAMPFWLTGVRCVLTYLAPLLSAGLAPMLRRFGLILQLCAAAIALSTCTRLYCLRHRYRHAYLVATVVITVMAVHHLTHLRLS